MNEKRFYISGIGISDRERKRLYDLKTVDGFISVRDLLNELYEENQKLKEDAKQVLFVLACCNRDFGLSVNEAKAIKRLNECVDGSYNINNIKEFLDD